MRSCLETGLGELSHLRRTLPGGKEDRNGHCGIAKGVDSSRGPAVAG